MTRKILFAFAFVVFTAIGGYAQNWSRVEWSKVPMDSTWNTPAGAQSVTGEILKKYRPAVDSLEIVIGYAPVEMTKYMPQCPLSNMTVDIMKIAAQRFLDLQGKGEKVDMAITNFGGLRSNFAKGNVTVGDVYSMYPFYNYVNIVDLRGKYIKMLFEAFAKRGKFEAFSGARVVVEGKVLKEFTIGGAPVEDEKIYRIATLDFLIAGGDKVFAFRYLENAVPIAPKPLLRDVMLDYLLEMQKQGRPLEWPVDDRITIIK